tara:strand:+ start:5221 stop:5529 length:309 start_codon:yes stop_codon:yes gene_type:complete
MKRYKTILPKKDQSTDFYDPGIRPEGYDITIYSFTVYVKNVKTREIVSLEGKFTSIDEAIVYYSRLDGKEVVGAIKHVSGLVHEYYTEDERKLIQMSRRLKK